MKMMLSRTAPEYRTKKVNKLVATMTLSVVIMTS